MDAKKVALGVAVCGALTFLGVLLPWYGFSFDLPRGLEGPSGLSLNGTEGDYAGTFTLVLGLVAGAAALIHRKGPPQGFPLGAYPLALVALGAFGLATVVTLVDLFGHGPQRSFRGHKSPFSGGTGVGLYLTLGATAVGAWFAWRLFKKTPAPSPSVSPPPPPSTPPPAPSS